MPEPVDERVATRTFLLFSSFSRADSSRRVTGVPGGKPGEKDDNAVLAEVGPYKITRKELDRRLAQLEPELQRSFNTPESRRSFFRRGRGEADPARRRSQAGLEKQPEVKERLADARTQVLVRQYIPTS